MTCSSIFSYIYLINQNIEKVGLKTLFEQLNTFLFLIPLKNWWYVRKKWHNALCFAWISLCLLNKHIYVIFVIKYLLIFFLRNKWLWYKSYFFKGTTYMYILYILSRYAFQRIYNCILIVRFKLFYLNIIFRN